MLRHPPFLAVIQGHGRGECALDAAAGATGPRAATSGVRASLALLAVPSVPQPGAVSLAGFAGGPDRGAYPRSFRRSIDRPRWMRDITVPKGVPIISAISQYL